MIDVQSFLFLLLLLFFFIFFFLIFVGICLFPIYARVLLVYNTQGGILLRPHKIFPASDNIVQV